MIMGIIIGNTPQLIGKVVAWHYANIKYMEVNYDHSYLVGTL